MRARTLLAVLGPAAAVLMLSGCNGIFGDFVFSGLCTPGTGTGGVPIDVCTFTSTVHLSNFCSATTTLTVDAHGCLPPWTTQLGGSVCGRSNPTAGYPCTFQPGASVTVTYWTQDPLLVEMPSTWHPKGVSTWKNLTTPDSGFVNAVQGATVNPGGGVGPIVLDPGYSAWLVWMDHASNGDIQATFTFATPPGDSACIKGMEVDVLVLSGAPVGILPSAPGQTFDFTQLPNNGPNSMCVGPATVTPARRRSWGELKLLYH